MELQTVKAVCGMFLSNSVAGIINLTGTVAPYLLSYIYDKNQSAHLSIVLTSSFIAITIQVLNFYIISQLSTKFSEISLMIFGLFLSTIGLFSLSYINNTFLLILTLGCSLGCYGSFMLYPAMWIGLKKVNYDKRGLATGLGLSSFAVSPFIYGCIFSYIINPNNSPPTKTITYKDEKLNLFDKDVYSRLPITFQYLSLILFIIGFFAVILMFDKSVNVKKNNYTITLRQLVKECKFWYLLALNYLKMLYFMFIVNVYKTVGLINISDDYFLAYIGGLGFILSAILRIIFGKILDKYPWHKVNFIATLAELILILTYYYFLSNKTLYAISTVLMLGISGTSYLSLWVLCDIVFPMDKWIFSILSLGGVLATFTISAFFSGLIIPILGYEFAFHIIAALQIVCLILIYNQQSILSLSRNPKQLIQLSHK